MKQAVKLLIEDMYEHERYEEIAHLFMVCELGKPIATEVVEKFPTTMAFAAKHLPESKPKASTSKGKEFVPPTVEQVREYCKEHGYNIDPVLFVAYYEARDWYLTRGKVKSWEACVSTWVRNDAAREKERMKNGQNYQENIKVNF